MRVRWVIGLLVLSFAAVVLGDDPAKPAQPTPDEMQQAMQNAQPGPMNERLMKLAGEWTTSTTMRGAGMPETRSTGTAALKAAIGGRAIHETGTGEFMGQPVESFRMWGFNNGSKKYEAVWSWNMNTGFLYMQGQSSDNGKTIEWNAWFNNELGVREEFKATMTFVDDDHFTVRLYGGKMPDGSEGPEMIEEHSRKK